MEESRNKPKREKYSHNLHIMVTARERIFLESAAFKRGLSIAGLVRNAVYEKIARDERTTA